MNEMNNPGALAGATGALAKVHAKADGRETITIGTKREQGRRRASDDGCRDVVVQVNPAWRVIRCRTGSQWILQRRAGQKAGRARWTGALHFRTRAALIDACQAYCGACDPAALAALALLPEAVP